MGESHLRLTLRCDGRRMGIDAVMFNARIERIVARIRAAYSLDINEWNGSRKLRLLLVARRAGLIEPDRAGRNAQSLLLCCATAIFPTKPQ